MEACERHSGVLKHPALPTKGEPKHRFRRLWRGEQPLGEAFWLYGVLGGYAAIFAAGAVFYVLGNVLQYMGFGGQGALIAALIALPLLLLYLAVAYVGIWRSASGRGFWGFLARMAILFVVLKLGWVTYLILHG